MKYKVGMVSLGCPKNQVDAEIMLKELHGAGYKLVEDAAMGDVAIVNTCGFIESAKAESIQEILELAKLKAEGKIKAIVVTGCMAERYRDEVMNEIPEIDAVVSIGANKKIAEVVGSVLEGEKVKAFDENTNLNIDGERILTTKPYYAYIKVAEGCDNCCSYCAIPMIRGKFRSRTIESVVGEAVTLSKKGVKELILVAQDTTRYGEDIYGTLALPKLLRELCKVEGIEWIRLLYCYPERITDELLEVMAQEPKICKYMDIPLQHCNGEILRSMNRTGDKESLLSLLSKIRSKVQGITLRTTVMVGFPGETRKHFEELCEFVREAKFEKLGCFEWSAEEGTPAYDFPDRVSDKEKSRRQEVVMDEQSRVIDSWCEEMQGRELYVIAEGFDRLAECCFGRSCGEAPEIDGMIFFTTDGKKLTAGDIVKVKITDSLGTDLIGEMIAE
ncbi:MAG: 30S ribosomal protein S12 methylthiotransferase RimO [Oscillospiraceae bacterium]|nr:30S ribosomal protein S12 methylthiotransferase RimO [Oscillospiraceae bacterium]